MGENSKSSLLGLSIFAVVCLLLPASFIALHLTTPSDGARLSSGENIFTPLGAIVSPYSPSDSPIQEDDIVIAVDKVPMEKWAVDLFEIGVSRPERQFDQTLTYSVLRGDKTLDAEVTLGRLPLGSILSSHWGAILFAFVSQLLALFVILRRPADPASRALFIWAMSGSHTYAWSFFLQVSDIVGGIGFWLFRLSTPGLWLIYWPAALQMAFVFPKPLPVVRRYPRLIPGFYVLSYLIFLVYLLVTWPGSINMLDWLNKWVPAETLVAGFFLFIVLLTMIWQYRTSRTYTERAKIRWAIFGGIISGSLGLIFWLILPVFMGIEILDANLLGLLMLLFPLSLAIAIWRHQLFDIDVIIRRTLVYGSLTILLVSFYFITVLFLQRAFTEISGQQSTIAIVITTLVIAALFNPLRIQIQQLIDRRFFRAKYNAEQSLTAFAQTARNEANLDELTAKLQMVIIETIQPEHVTLWLNLPTVNKANVKRK